MVALWELNLYHHVWPFLVESALEIYLCFLAFNFCPYIDTVLACWLLFCTMKFISSILYNFWAGLMLTGNGNYLLTLA